MQDLSLHILDIIENSIRAGASNVQIRIEEDTRKNLFSIEIQDNGKGMDDKELDKVRDPFYTTKTCRNVGLGIPLLEQSARDCNGNLEISAAKGKGSTLKVWFDHDHIDRKPLGDMAETISVIIASNPDIDLEYSHKKDEKSYVLSTSELRQELEDVPINSPDVIKIIKNNINQWLKY